jgi:AcrR family transcriptional regulator
MSRPRDFDEGQAVEAALKTFWRYGYDGSSLSDLLSATGVARSSFYRTFDSKQALFDRCVDLYHAKYLAFRDRALEAPTATELLARLLHGLVELHTNPDTPPGCLETNAALAASPESASIQAKLAANRESLRGPLEERLRVLLVQEGRSQAVDAATLASFTLTFNQGLAVRANSGATRGELEKDVEFFLDSLVAIKPQPGAAD